MAEFPARRFHDADATLDEVAQLKAEFDTSDSSVQEGYDELFRSMSLGGIRTWLNERRSEGHFGKDPESPESPETPLEADSSESIPDATDKPETDEDSEFDANLLGTGDAEPKD